MTLEEQVNQAKEIIVHLLDQLLASQKREPRAAELNERKSFSPHVERRHADLGREARSPLIEAAELTYQDERTGAWSRRAGRQQKLGRQARKPR